MIDTHEAHHHIEMLKYILSDSAEDVTSADILQSLVRFFTPAEIDEIKQYIKDSEPEVV